MGGWKTLPREVRKSSSSNYPQQQQQQQQQQEEASVNQEDPEAFQVFLGNTKPCNALACFPP